VSFNLFYPDCLATNTINGLGHREFLQLLQHPVCGLADRKPALRRAQSPSDEPIWN
jgi:hypothetical protein